MIKNLTNLDVFARCRRFSYNALKRFEITWIFLKLFFRNVKPLDVDSDLGKDSLFAGKSSDKSSAVTHRGMHHVTFE
jgi:hypothetical protein